MSEDQTVVLTNITEALASSEKEAEAKPPTLVVVGGELNGTLFDLIEEQVTAGRNPDNGIHLEFDGVSRYHFKVFSSEEDSSKFFVEDLGSKNGTFLNNQKLEGEAELQKGDMVKVGNIALKFLPKGDPERLTFEKLQHEANVDQHTGCFNKTYFNNALDTEVKKCKLTGSPLSLIVLDLDHFKSLNDNHGHDAGDYVLKELAELIRGNGVREKDIFARYGGEEFVILLPQTNIKNAYDIAERLRVLIEGHKFIYEEKELPVTASIGLSDYRQGVDSGTDLFKRADEAVYMSKEAGRNAVSFFKPNE